MKLGISRAQRASYSYLLKWCLIALVAGVLAPLLVHVFRYALGSVTEKLAALPLPLPVWSLAGAVLAGGIIYRIQPDAAGEGMPSYLQALNQRDSRFAGDVTALKYCSGFTTLATFGNGGVVGPLGRVVAGLMASLVQISPWRSEKSENRRTAAICGMAAVLGTIFHSPVGGGVFAVEIIQKARMGFKDLFPSILSSIIAVALCKAVGLEPFYRFNVVPAAVDLATMGWAFLLAVVLGVVGSLYSRFYAFIVRLFKRDQGNVLLKVTLGTAVAAIPAWILNRHLMGTSSALFDAIFSRDLSILSGNLSAGLPPVLLIAIMLVAKAVFNCVTVGSGMSAGFTGPSIIIGMLLGMLAAEALGLRFGTGEYYALVATGFAGMLASSMNVPLAAAIMAIEVFGLTYSLPAGMAAIIGFQINRHQTIYDYALAGSGREE